MEYGANIYGLHLEGCRVNHETLSLEQSHYKEMLFSIPNLKFLFLTKNGAYRNAKL